MILIDLGKKKKFKGAKMPSAEDVLSNVSDIIRMVWGAGEE